MLEKYIPKRFATAMIKHIIAVTLFFPYIYSHNDNPAYADFMLVNVFVILAMVFICISWKLDFKHNGIFVGILGILLLAYNGFATYMNVKYHHWYGDQFNTTLAFLFFMLLLLVRDSHALIDTATIKATIHMIVASNVLAIIFRVFTGYNRLRFMNNWVALVTYPEHLTEQFSWFYDHKSEYGLILVLCVAFFVTYRKQFQNIFTYILSLGVLFVALYLSNSYTSMGAVLFIFVGQFLDFLIKASWWKKLIATLFATIPSLLIIKEFATHINVERNILTLGYRTYIWNSFVEYIKQNPNGIPDVFGTQNYLVVVQPHRNIWVNNCHNVFLNHMFRFSIPVGTIFFLLCITLVLFSIKRLFSLTTLCTWGSVFILLMMDQSLNALELSFVLLLSFILFFQKKHQKNPGNIPLT